MSITKAMEYLKGDKGRGRTIVRDELIIGGVRLLAGDRLDPSPALIDPGRFEFLRLPATVVFWRVTRGH
eukprot:1429272-Pyramimonas_sp.AAC.1